MLQTEMKRKVNAFQERLQREPAFPDGEPSRGTIMGARKTSHPGVRPPSEIRADGHGEGRLTRALGHHRQQQRLNHLMSRALWLGTRKSTYLHQAHRQWGQQPQ